ncbi:MAG: hypothetical protein GY765_26250 [bacterium]|nr:hypothetical protein [bacterium]
MKPRYVFLLIVLFVLSILPLQGADAVSSATDTWDPPPAGYTYKVTLVRGIPHYVVMYSDNFYRGGNVSATGAKRLAAFGVTTIISIFPNDHLKKAAESAGLKLIHFLFPSDVMPRQDIEKFVKYLKENKGSIYIHSKEQEHKAGILGAIYRLNIEKWSYEKTLIEFGRLGGNLKRNDRLLRAIKPRPKKDNTKAKK